MAPERKPIRRLTRQQLYELIWSQPMRTLASQFSISDVAIAKACRNADIPVPPRGYWAKLLAGQAADQPPLPSRGLGKSDQVIFGGARWQRNTWPEVDFTKPLPPAPQFPDDINAIRELVQKRVGKVTVPKTLSNTHGEISRLLQDDQERLEKQKASLYVPSWEKPRFESTTDQRRLRILNAIFLSVGRYGCTSSAKGKEDLDISVCVGDTNVNFTLDVLARSRRSTASEASASRLHREDLRLAITTWREDTSVRNAWQDDEQGTLESKATQIVVEMIIAGELLHRESELRHHRWLVERKDQLEKEALEKKAAQVQKERERLTKLEAARVTRLLDQATALRQAREIRAFVDEVRQVIRSSGAPIDSGEFDSWSEWALSQANRIDPTLNGAFSSTMDDSDPLAD